MKNIITKGLNFIQENQNGLFKIAVLLILLYCTHILKDISNIYIDLSSVETELSDIASKLSGIEMALTK